MAALETVDCPVLLDKPDHLDLAVFKAHQVALDYLVQVALVDLRVIPLRYVMMLL